MPKPIIPIKKYYCRNYIKYIVWFNGLVLMTDFIFYRRLKNIIGPQFIMIRAVRKIPISRVERFAPAGKFMRMNRDISSFLWLFSTVVNIIIYCELSSVSPQTSTLTTVIEFRHDNNNHQTIIMLCHLHYTL